MPNPNAATVNLVFSSFTTNNASVPTSGAPGGTYCPMSSLAIANDPTSGNPINASGQVTISGSGSSAKVCVKHNAGNSANIQITFAVSCSADSINYYPQDIVFVQNVGTGDPSGNTNFPGANRDPNNTTITIMNKMSSTGSGNSAPKWNFYIQIKQMNTGNPTPAQPFGWIDPLIENDA
jgi:hypothetical protein